MAESCGQRARLGTDPIIRRRFAGWRVSLPRHASQIARTLKTLREAHEVILSQAQAVR